LDGRYILDGRKEAGIFAHRPHTWWIIGITSALVAAFIGMFSWMLSHSYEIIVDDTFDSTSNLALSVDQFVAHTIKTIDLSLQVVIDEIDAGQARSPRAMQALLAARLERLPEIAGLAVLDPEGHVRASSADFPPVGVKLANAAFFRKAREQDGIRVALDDPSGQRADGKQLVLSRRYQRADGSLAGVVAATLNRDYLQQFFSTLHIGKRGIIIVATIDGTALVSWPYRADYIGKNFGRTTLFTKWLPFASSGVLTVHFPEDSEWHITGYQRVEKLPLVALVALSRNEALTHWRGTMLVQKGAGTALVTALLLMAWYLNREFTARLNAYGQLSATVLELDRARLAAEESSRVKSQFMAHMSHELRTPLNAIIGFSEMIRDAVMGPINTRYRDYAVDIHKSGAHLLRLINDVLDLSKVEAGRLDLHEETVSLAGLVDDCQRLVTDRLTAGELKLSIELPPDLPAIRGDAQRLKQVLLNLLSNAVKFTPRGGCILLSAAMTAEGGIALAIRDTGIGMAPDEIPLALEPFRQLDGAFNRRFEGTGLGLPLARRLAEMHGGQLQIASATGEGTTATLILPASRVIERAPATPDQPRSIKRDTGA
jgi:signal transduction histidine kinase